jgi:hypothetical protein
MLPVPVMVTAVVELDDTEGSADADRYVAEVMLAVRTMVDHARQSCATPGRCWFHRVRLVIGSVGRLGLDELDELELTGPREVENASFD